MRVGKGQAGRDADRCNVEKIKTRAHFKVIKGESGDEAAWGSETGFRLFIRLVALAWPLTSEHFRPADSKN